MLYKQVLREVDGDVDTAIEFLIADQQASDGNDTEDKSSKDINHHGNALHVLWFVQIFYHIRSVKVSTKFYSVE